MNPGGARRESRGVLALLVDVWVDPGLAFRTVLEGPLRWATVLIPWLLFVGVASIDLLVRSGGQSDWRGPLIFDSDPEGLRAYLRSMGVISLIVGTAIALVLNSLLLWGLGRFLARNPVRFLDALRIMGLSLAVPILGGVATLLLVQSAGDLDAQFSLGYLLGIGGSGLVEMPFLAAINLFHLWYLVVIAVGLSVLTDLSGRICFGICGIFWIIPKLLAF